MVQCFVGGDGAARGEHGKIKAKDDGSSVAPLQHSFKGYTIWDPHDTGGDRRVRQGWVARVRQGSGVDSTLHKGSGVDSTLHKRGWAL